MGTNAELLQDLQRCRENRPTLDLLGQQIHSSVGVIPFVGAGLSRPCGFPLWTEFLLDQAKYSGKLDTIAARLREGEYEEAAEDILLSRGRRRFEDVIAHTFGIEQLNQQGICGPVCLLPLLSAGPVLTTNFDQVLERVFDDAKLPFTQKISGGRISSVVRAMSKNERILIKLHGDYNEPIDRVLTLTEYVAAYGSPDAAKIDISKPLPRLLRLTIENRPLLFLGCSLNQDRTLGVLHRVASEYPELAHYAIVELPKSDAEVISRDKFLSDHGIRPIWYPTGAHDSIEVLLQYLVSFASVPGAAVGASRPSVHPLVQPPNETSGLRAELQSAGYPDPQASSLTVSRIVGKARHSTVHRCKLAGKEVIVKRTRKEICNIETLRRIQGRSITVNEGGVSTNVATPIWVGESADNVIEIQPFCEGITLERMIRRSRSTVSGDLLGQIYVCLILATRRLHDCGVLHRDVTPSNVLITGEEYSVRLSLIDCSFACNVDETPQLPVQNANYTPPEQIGGWAVPVSDWYSVAGTCYFLANGSPPDSANRTVFEDGLKRIKTGLYSGPWVDGKWWHSRKVIEALLVPDSRQRPADLWRVLLETSSWVAGKEDEDVIGALDLEDAGIVLLRNVNWVVVSRLDLADWIVKEVSHHRINDPALLRYLESLKVKA